MKLLMTKNLRKSFGETHAVDDVDFAIEEGEVLSLVGPNGAGKTTLINLISGLIPSDEGTIVFQGNDITEMSINKRIKAGIARSFQIVNLFDQLTTLDNVALTILSREGKTRKFMSLAESDDDVRQEALEILEQFGMKNKRNVEAAGLAQGERKLLDIAVAYSLKPKLLLLDEPTSGVSTREKGGIMDTICSIVRAGSTTAAIVEHDMDLVFKYSDRVVAMALGNILADGTPDEVRENEKVKKILLGTDESDV